MTDYSNVEDNHNVEMSNLNDKSILVQIIDVTHKTLIEEIKLNEVKAK